MSMPLRILELRSVRGTGGGPEKTILAGAALSDPGRYAITVCYVRDLRDPVFEIDTRATALRLDYVEISERHSFDPAIWPALRQLVRDRKIDIVHSHDYKTNFYAWLLSLVEPIVPLATLHGYTGHSWRERIYYAADKRIVRRFPMLVAVSEDLRHELIKAGSSPDRVVRVLNGIDHTAFVRDVAVAPRARASLGLAEGEFVIGAVGRLERQKRFDLLMQAFASLQQRHPGTAFRLVIVGDGTLREELETERQRLGLAERCILTGHRSDVAGLHHAFDVFVQSSDYEGTPNAVLEAMALETPVVATDVGGTAELLENGLEGVIIPPGQPGAIVSEIERILLDPRSARLRAIAARQRIERELSFQARMTAIEALYDRLASTQSAGDPAPAVGRA